MKTLRVSEITKMKSTDLVKIVEKWKKYDPKVVLIANSELKKRNYNISYSLEKKQNEFSLKYNQTDINKFLDKYLKDDSYPEFFIKGIETVLKNTNSNTTSETFQANKETGNVLVNLGNNSNNEKSKVISKKHLNPQTTSQENKVFNVTLIGGLIGLFGDSPQKSLNRKIKNENENGWKVIQVIPSASGNILLILLRLLILFFTVFFYTTANGYYVIMERKE